MDAREVVEHIVQRDRAVKHSIQFAFGRKLMYPEIAIMDTSKYKTPGQLLKALLEERGWTKRVLAIVLDMGEPGVHKLVADKQALTAELALTLEEIFKVDADRFLELQRGYDLAKARISVQPDPDRNTRAHLFGELPIAEMIKRGWLEADDVRNVKGVEAALAKFFGVSSSNEIEILPIHNTDVWELPDAGHMWTLLHY